MFLLASYTSAKHTFGLLII